MHAEDPNPRAPQRTDWILGALLVLATWAVYWRSAGNGFVWYDDPSYLLENSKLNTGFSWEGVRWAFTEAHSANWHPLTWLSHMLDCELFGLEPAGHHLMSVGIHSLNALLCFLVLRAATGARWKSALCATLFALHPLRVQSVAWASERKDLLAGLFFFLCLWSYIRYARRPSALSYLLVAITLALGLMSKPMLVTLPVLLLLFDYWPLGRLASCTPQRLVLEKLPLFGLVAASIVVTVLAQDEGGAFRFASSLPLLERVPHAASSVLWYLRSSLWPTDLACFYPHPALVDPNWNPWLQSLPAFGLGLLALWLFKRGLKCCPALPFGMLWMLLMLAPVIGLVQVGEQAWADRYAYLPTLGLYIALVWPLAGLAQKRGALRLSLGVLACVACVAAGLRTRQEVPHWASTESLAGRALAVTENNYVARLGLGNQLLAGGDMDGAERHFLAARDIRSDSTDLTLSLSALYQSLEAHGQAIELYTEALERHPKWLLIRMRLGIALAKNGQPEAAIRHLSLARFENPNNSDLDYNLALAHLAAGQAKWALPLLDACLQRSEKFFEARIARGEAYFQLRQYPAALRNLQRGARVAPRRAAARLALILASAPQAKLRDPQAALQWATQALKLNAGAEALEAMAAAQAAVGRFGDAEQTQLSAIELYPKRKREAARARLASYRKWQQHLLPL